MTGYFTAASAIKVFTAFYLDDVATVGATIESVSASDMSGGGKGPEYCRSSNDVWEADVEPRRQRWVSPYPGLVH